MQTDPGAPPAGDQQSPNDLRRQMRERWARDVARRYPELVGRAQLSDPLSREVRDGGWGPDTLSAESLLGSRFREASAGTKAALAYLAMATVIVLSEDDGVLEVAMRMARADDRHMLLVGLIMDQRRNATHEGMDPKEALGERLLRAVDELRTEGLPSDARRFGWLMGRSC